MTNVERPVFIEGGDFRRLQEAEEAFLTGGEGQLGDVAGLALSGGGIRSAAFALGVMQALVAGGKLDAFHYLSTVSGGGYAGSALTWWLHRGLPTPEATTAGTTPENFPFGSRSRNGEVPLAQNAILDFLRQHASYLNPTPRLGLISVVAVVLRSAFLSLFVYFTLLVGVMGLLLSAHFFDPLPAAWFGPVPALGNYLSSPLLYGSFMLVAFLIVSALVYSLTTRFSRGSRSYVFRTTVQIFIGRAAVVVCAATFVGTLPWIYILLGTALRLFADPDGPVHEQLSALGLAAGSTLLGTLLGAQEGQAAATGKRTVGWFAKNRPLLAVALLIYGLVLGSLAVADAIRERGGVWWVFAAIVACGFSLAWFSNVNYLGAHRMYRDRLMELFLPSAEAVRENQWAMARAADETGIHDVCGADRNVCKRPYHLINANVVLVDSPKSAFRGRGGDAFLLSPLYVGSGATGWARSSAYMSAARGKGMSLPSAMAISGAALNPNTGPAGLGLTRGYLVSALLQLLNLRLGYWAPNPGGKRSRVPNFIDPGLDALRGRGLREDRPLVELSDGGHFENLGIYELVRRRARLIVVCDGAEDGNYEFADLANAVGRVRVDFGAKIEFGERFPLAGLLPRGAGSGDELAVAKFGLSDRAFAVGSIRYSGDPYDAPSGQLVYVKTTIFSGLPADVLGYRLASPAFPNESTSDQFFDERQFEAYRELGYHAGWNTLEHAEIPALAPPGRSTERVAAGLVQAL